MSNSLVAVSSPIPPQLDLIPHSLLLAVCLLEFELTSFTIKMDILANHVKVRWRLEKKNTSMFIHPLTHSLTNIYWMPTPVGNCVSGYATWWAKQTFTTPWRQRSLLGGDDSQQVNKQIKWVLNAHSVQEMESEHQWWLGLNTASKRTLPGGF